MAAALAGAVPQAESATAATTIATTPVVGLDVLIEKLLEPLRLRKRNLHVALTEAEITSLCADSRPLLLSEPTLLELYRADPTGVRRSIQRNAETTRNCELFGAICRLFGRR